MSRIPSSIILFLIGILTPLSLYAASVPVTEDSTLILPGDGSQYTVTNGSVFDNIDIQTGSFIFYLSGGESLTLTSADRKSLTSNPAFSATCATNQSNITLTLPSGAPAQPIILTPGGTCSNTTGGGGSPTIGQVTPVSRTLGPSQTVITPPRAQTPTQTPQSPAPAPAPTPASAAGPVPTPRSRPARSRVPAPVLTFTPPGVRTPTGAPRTPAVPPEQTSGGGAGAVPTPIPAPTPIPPLAPIRQSPGSGTSIVVRFFTGVFTVFARAAAFIRGLVFPSR